MPTTRRLNLTTPPPLPIRHPRKAIPAPVGSMAFRPRIATGTPTPDQRVIIHREVQPETSKIEERSTTLLIYALGCSLAIMVGLLYGYGRDVSCVVIPAMIVWIMTRRFRCHACKAVVSKKAKRCQCCSSFFI